jgi:SAM-dependent methyltransferase
MTDPEVDTIGYYDWHAADFAVQTAGLDLEPVYRRFLRHVRPGGHILDAGCGTGWDALAFARRGHAVVAFDASAAMVRQARAHVGDQAEVHHLRFQDLRWQDAFDGVWTCASLLHVPARFFSGVASLLAAALRPGGTWCMSFKPGTTQRVNEGRLFVDHTEDSLRSATAAIPVVIAKTWISHNLRSDRRHEQWLNAIAVRATDAPMGSGITDSSAGWPVR